LVLLLVANTLASTVFITGNSGSYGWKKAFANFAGVFDQDTGQVIGNTINNVNNTPNADFPDAGFVYRGKCMVVDMPFLPIGPNGKLLRATYFSSFSSKHGLKNFSFSSVAINNMWPMQKVVIDEKLDVAIWFSTQVLEIHQGFPYISVTPLGQGQGLRGDYVINHGAYVMQFFYDSSTSTLFAVSDPLGSLRILAYQLPTRTLAFNVSVDPNHLLGYTMLGIVWDVKSSLGYALFLKNYKTVQFHSLRCSRSSCSFNFEPLLKIDDPNIANQTQYFNPGALFFDESANELYVGVPSFTMSSSNAYILVYKVENGKIAYSRRIELKGLVDFQFTSIAVCNSD
jgi:hypothetical protein